ncbi:uncharacterized protein insb [Euwallacea fornicatus]|uniref:uncharacterized protein insb n=1 Tax=Euwallacea fornicatus TaxID=995702 RepID=UPI00338FD95C
MKARRGTNNQGRCSGRRVIRHPKRDKEQDHVTEMLRLCLQKIAELQTELEEEPQSSHDPEVEGYAACATEALRFLSAQGLPPDHPMVKALAEKLLMVNRD